MVQVSVRGIIGACIPAVSIILIFIAMFSNGWYSVEYDGDIDELGITECEYEAKFGLTEYESHEEGISNGIPYTSSKNSFLKDEREDVGMLTLVFLIISLILIFAFVAAGILAGLHLIPGWIAMLIGFVAIVCLIFPLIYYPIAQPDAVEKVSEDIENVLPDEVI